MSDYLSTLAMRSQGVQPTLRPRIASRFEPLPGAAPAGLDFQRDELSLSETDRESGEPKVVGISSADVQTQGTAASSSAGLADAPAKQPSRAVQPTASTPSRLVESTPHQMAPQRVNAVSALGDNESSIVPRLVAPLPRLENSVAPKHVAQPHVTRHREAVPPREVPTGTAPTIKVTIGRIEVRAVTPAPPPRVQPSAPSTPRLSIDEYLKQRSGGQR